MSDRPYRILSLDGGGSWALIQVRALQKIFSHLPEDASGHEILQNFDLVAANSGGSIVAGGLLEGMSLKQINDLFTNEAQRKKIFVSLLDRPVTKLIGIGPRYSTPEKLVGLRGVFGNFGDRTLPEITAEIKEKAQASGGRATDVLIASFDYDRKRAVYFRSNMASYAATFTQAGLQPTLAEAIHASSNAPINYFDRPAETSVGRFWDGGVAGLNNPVFAAVIEALANGIAPERIQVMSIGTGGVVLPMKSDLIDRPLALVMVEPSFTEDLSNMAGSILDDPPDAATFHSHVALNQPIPVRVEQTPVNGSVFRFNPQVQPIVLRDNTGMLNYSCPPDYTEEEFDKLSNLGMDAVDQSEVDMIVKFCDAWLNDQMPNQPIRANANLECEIGFNLFSQGLRLWNDMVSRNP